jgi:hypothetical protein
MNAPTGKEKLTTAIMPNDIVKHMPTEEKWTVCGVNYELDALIPCGHPFPSMAKISDCTLIEKRYTKEPQTTEQINALKRCGLLGFIDVASMTWEEIT